MSCGNPHEVDCTEVLHEVYLYLDGEMDANGLARVRQHLDECSPCLRQFGIEQEFKALLARCCGGDHAPAGLRDRIVTKLQQVRLEITQVEFRAE